MSIKQESVSMPMGSAGIIGFSSDMRLGGFEIDPKMLIIFTACLVFVVKAADLVLRSS